MCLYDTDDSICVTNVNDPLREFGVLWLDAVYMFAIVFAELYPRLDNFDCVR
ncbi:hypothetical protein FALCPG4_009046 [Fusarium falciforme]